MNIYMEGPLLVQCTGGSKTSPAVCKPKAGAAMWTFSASSNSVRRKRPADIITTPTTAYSRSRAEFVRSVQHYEHGNKGPGPIVSDAIFPYELRVTLEDRARVRFLEKLKDTTWNVGTFVGELPETLGFLTSMGKTLLQSVSAVKRMRWKKARQILRKWYRSRNKSVKIPKKAGDMWLAWRYAVTPMMYDMEDMMAAFADTGLRRFIRRVATKMTDDATNVSIFAGVTTIRQFVRTVGRGAYYTVNPIMDKWKRYGLLNFVETLWELTPLSFVVDWFIPIGQGLAQLDAEAGVGYLQKWRSSLEFQNHRNSGKNLEPSTYKSKTYRRMNPGDTYTVPKYKPHITVDRYYDLLALVNGFRR